MRDFVVHIKEQNAKSPEKKEKSKKQEEKKISNLRKYTDEKEKTKKSEEKSGNNENVQIELDVHFKFNLSNESAILLKEFINRIQNVYNGLIKFDIPVSSIKVNFGLLSVNPTIYYSGLIFGVLFKKKKKIHVLASLR